MLIEVLKIGYKISKFRVILEREFYDWENVVFFFLKNEDLGLGKIREFEGRGIIKN